MPHLNSTFVALLKEAQFTKQLLGSGATDIRKANYAAKGRYFQSFTNLSTGLERIGKLCLMLDIYIETCGKFPDFKYMKNEIGHNLELIQSKLLDVITRRNINITPPSTPVHKEIIHVLSSFAEGDRYSNINLLIGSKQISDPIKSWVSKVDAQLFEHHISLKKKKIIADRASVSGMIMERFCSVLHISDNGNEITTPEEAVLQTEIYNAVAPYRQLYVLQIIRFWSELLIELGWIARKVQNEDIPFFNEIFGPFGNSDSYIKGRKTWDSL